MSIHSIISGGGSPEYTAGEHNRAHWHPFARAVRIDPWLALRGQLIKRAQGQCGYSLLQRVHGWMRHYVVVGVVVVVQDVNFES